MNHEIDPSRQKYPYCIVWSPLPPISWIFPFIGHTGIADSKGSYIFHHQLRVIVKITPYDSIRQILLIF